MAPRSPRPLADARLKLASRWIGWDEDARRRNLQRVVNNSRQLLLPWVRVKNLASTTLGLVARSFPDDWEQRFGVRPVLLETLVDSTRFRGICYRAANWLPLGTTSGRGRMDRAHQRYGQSPKKWRQPRPSFVEPQSRIGEPTVSVIPGTDHRGRPGFAIESECKL